MAAQRSGKDGETPAGGDDGGAGEGKSAGSGDARGGGKDPGGVFSSGLWLARRACEEGAAALLEVQELQHLRTVEAQAPSGSASRHTDGAVRAAVLRLRRAFGVSEDGLVDAQALECALSLPKGVRQLARGWTYLEASTHWKLLPGVLAHLCCTLPATDEASAAAEAEASLLLLVAAALRPPSSVQEEAPARKGDGGAPLTVLIECATAMSDASEAKTAVPLREALGVMTRAQMVHAVIARGEELAADDAHGELCGAWNGLQERFMGLVVA